MPEAEGESIRELLERLRAEMAALASAEAQLGVSRHRTQLRRRAVDAGGALAVAVALLTAFGVANAAAVYGLSTALPAWAAALAVAGAWLLIALLLAVALRVRADRGVGWAWWRPLTGGLAGDRERLEEERDRARRDVLATLEELVPELTERAAAAAVPVAVSVAGGMAAGAAGGVVDAGSDLIEGSDELVESITVEMPGGGMVNQVWDVVLMPGRWGVKVVTTVLKRPPPEG